MPYYLLDDDMEMEDRWFIGDLNFSDNLSMTEALYTDYFKNHKWQGKLQLKGKALDITFSDFNTLLVNEKFINCINSDQIEYVPIKIKGYMFSADLYVLRIVHIVDCIDRTKSKFSLIAADDPVRPDLAGEFEMFEKMVIDENLVRGIDIFCVKGYEQSIIVSEKIKRCIEAKELKGVVLERVS